MVSKFKETFTSKELYVLELNLNVERKWKKTWKKFGKERKKGEGVEQKGNKKDRHKKFYKES